MAFIFFLCFLQCMQGKNVCHSLASSITAGNDTSLLSIVTNKVWCVFLRELETKFYIIWLPVTLGYLYHNPPQAHFILATLSPHY